MDEPEPLLAFPEDFERALCIVAHPDDIEYGAAMAVARWTDQGKQVAYVLATSGEAGIDGLHPRETGPRREAEERASAAQVGVSTVEFMGWKDGVLEWGLRLRNDLARVIRRYRPDVIVSVNFRLTFGGPAYNMADHRVLGIALLDAARDAANRWIFPELLAEGLEPWHVRQVAFSGSPQPTHAVDVTNYLERGVASLACHQTYLDGLGGEFDLRAFLHDSSAATGARLGTELAVGLEVFDV